MPYKTSIFPSTKSILFAEGSFGKPGIIIISPAKATINPAPAESLISFIVKEKSDTYEYEFSLKLSNLEAVLADSGDIFLMDGEDVFYTIPAPFMTDENGEREIHIRWKL